MKERIARLKQIADELHDLANSFAGNKTGVVAARLHGVAGGIPDCIRMLEEGITAEDKLSLAEDWLANQNRQFIDSATLAKML